METIFMVLQLLAGISLLTLGRKLFWLFVASIGFISGLMIANLYIHERGVLLLIIALFAGFIGAMLAIFLQKLALFLAGFLAGGYLCSTFLQLFGFHTEIYILLAFLIGGIIGALLLTSLFEWTLIILSSSIGSYLIAQSFDLNILLRILVFFILLAFGITLQNIIRKKEQKSKAAHKRISSG